MVLIRKKMLVFVPLGKKWFLDIRATLTIWFFPFLFPLFLNLGDWWWKNLFQQIDFPSPFPLNFFSITNIISPIPSRKGRNGVSLSCSSPPSVALRLLPPGPQYCRDLHVIVNDSSPRIRHNLATTISFFQSAEFVSDRVLAGSSQVQISEQEIAGHWI